MFFQRYYLDCLSHASYMIADEKTGVAAVVDPQRDIDIYVADARKHRLTIKHVVLTHFHADFVAGHIELRNKFGAQIYLGARAQAEFDFQPLKDHSVITLGEVRLEALETPGHTPEGISLLVYGETNTPEKPYAVLTGDTLFLGDVGRPDLLASVGATAEELGAMLYDALHHQLLNLPNDTLVYPAHGAGSMCGKQLSDESVSTIGEQRKYNYALQPMSKKEFVALVAADQPEAPAYFVHDVLRNRQDRDTLELAMSRSMKPLSLDKVLSLQNAGAQIVDVRSAADFAGAHLHRSLNIGIDGKYATWAGTVLRIDTPIVIIADEGREEEAIMRLGRIGLENVSGYLETGMRAIAERSDLLASTQRITAPAVAELREDEVQVVDIRTASEWEADHIPGSINIPLQHLADRLPEVPTERQVIVHCQGGYRSSLAVSLLENAGRENVLDLVGGFKAWVQSGRPEPQNVL